MKKIITCLVAVFTLTAVSAQKKGEMYVGGNFGLGLSSSIYDGDSFTDITFSISPEFGYFVADNVKLGGSINYGLGSSFGVPMHSLVIAPNISYYLKVCDKFYYAPTVEVGFASLICDGDMLPGMGLGFGLGSFEVRPTPKIGISFSVLNLNYVMLSEFGDAFHQVDFNLWGSSSIGFKYYF